MKSKWKIYQLGDVVEIVNGGTPKSEVLEYWDGDVLWITPKDMGQAKNVFVSTTSRTISKLGLQKSSAKLIPKNSVILSTRAPIGHLIINLQEMATNQGCRGLIPKNNIDTKFLFYFLKSNIKLLNDLGTGTTFKELSKSALEKIKIPVPPIEEQKRIVEILDKAFEGIAQAEANTRRNLINARELFDSYLDRIFANKNNKWIDEKLGNISENLDNKRIPITKSKRTSGEIPYYGASGIVDYVDDFIFDEYLLLVSEDGANLLARTYPIAFSISGKAWVNNHAHVLKFNDISLQRFVEYFLNSISLERYVSGMAQPKLNQKALNSILIPIAPKEIREKVVNNLDSLKENVNSLETIYQRKLEAIAELKQSILEKAFTGQLSQ